jgi:hypothetical protein
MGKTVDVHPYLLVGFELMIWMFEGVKIFDAIDKAATVIKI